MRTDYGKLFNILKKRKISITKFRKESGLIKTDMDKIEGGMSLSVDAMKKICEYLQCDIPDFVTFND